METERRVDHSVIYEMFRLFLALFVQSIITALIFIITITGILACFALLAMGFVTTLL